MDHIDVAQIDRAGIEVRHKIAIADCVMAWGAFDAHLRALLTSIDGRDLSAGAADYDKLWTQVAWTKLLQRLRDKGAPAESLAKVRAHKKAYSRHVEARNIMAHSGCVGVWARDRDYLVFAPFEAHKPGQMAIVCQPVSVIEQSTAWATAFSEMAHSIMTRLGY
ncbi:hypothetical protein [Novosphingobium ginsenosidimutans]|uniref:Uncharacterized protein n=1 Tax=Novosphingobium ginsenosidimutans TaxID=1176536 RepID=A0A5B8S5N2_9SPHN|nr:hypothetical protein FRF71_07875 [Novosphingobium ginsenosidimutans]